MISLLAALALLPQTFPPSLPDGSQVVTDASEELLKPTSTLRTGVTIAATAPAIDFMYFPGQDYPGKPWSNWGDSLAVNGKCYTAIGDHLAPRGDALVFEYDPGVRKLKKLLSVREVLNLPNGHYTPGKIHGRLDLGGDGWLYFSTHRGSTRVTTDAYHYRGDWILRHNPATSQTEVIACGPVPKHCLPTSVLDPKRLIFYGGTAPGNPSDQSGAQFFAYDCKTRRVLYSGPDGPARYMIFAKSSGRVYWVPGKEDMTGTLLRWDPDAGGAPAPLETSLGLRAATEETPQGMVYTVSRAARGGSALIYAFNTKTETAQVIGEAAVGNQNYITSIDADPSGRYLYYIPGAHGGAEQDGTPVVQFDVRTARKKVVAFLHPFYQAKYGCTLVGTFGSAIDEKGETLYITWNVKRGGRGWDCTAFTAIHIPASERD